MSKFYNIDSVERVKNDAKYVNGVNVGNCRLVSDINEMGYFNSIGGTALEVGSIKVNTINLARIAYENDKEHYLEALSEKVKLNLKCLDVVRGIIKRNVEKGLLPNYKLGIMNMDSQYNTVGIIGIFEVMQKYGMARKDEFGYTYYTDEQVPAERAAVVLMEKDKIFHPNEIYDKPLYGNQWIPLAVKTTIYEKIKISAELDKACSGGSISHINLSAPFTNFEQAWDVLNMVADAGVVYFAFCTRISACKNNHGFYGDVCPYCGGEVFTKYNRIVGFLVPDVNYSKERKVEFGMRDWMNVLNDEHSAIV